MIFLTGVLLVAVSYAVFKLALLKVEPVDAWSKQTVMVLRNSKNGGFWDDVSQVLASFDPEFNSALERVIQKTGNSPLVLARNLLPEPIEILVLEKNPNDGNTEALKYDFILITKSLGPGVENLNTQESVAKDFASWYLPQKRYILLPDQSQVAAEVADPDAIPVKNKFWRGLEIRYISEPGLPFEYAYIQNEGWLYFSTSKQALEQLVARDNFTLPFSVLSRNCAAPTKSVHIFLNPSKFKVEQGINMITTGSPVLSILGKNLSKQVKVKANNATFNWGKCGY